MDSFAFDILLFVHPYAKNLPVSYLISIRIHVCVEDFYFLLNNKHVHIIIINYENTIFISQPFKLIKKFMTMFKE